MIYIQKYFSMNVQYKKTSEIEEGYLYQFPAMWHLEQNSFKHIGDRM